MLFSLFLALILLTLVLLLVVFLKDRRRLRRKTVASIGKELWREIDEERQKALEKQKKFHKALIEAARKKQQ